MSKIDPNKVKETEAIMTYLRNLEKRIEALERAINSPEIVTQEDIDKLSKCG
jgi:hypothetical protein